MNPQRSSIFRNALQISSEFVSNLSDEQLNELMRRLFKAEAYKSKSPANEIRTNTEVKASDDGCDGWTAEPEVKGGWFGSVNTCWQFKAGIAGEPGRLSGEILKKIPKETLTNSERFVVIASGSTNGKKGEEARLAVLENEARRAGLPTDKIEVFGSERLTDWINQYPAVAAYFSGRPSGLWTFERWSRSEQHQVPWQASDDVKEQLLKLQSRLDFTTGDIRHLHIQGLPGVGKTRFALELCRVSSWCNTVVYIHQATDLPINELIDDATNDGFVQLMVVADEVQTGQLDRLRELVGRGEGRVRLITIGLGKTPDPTRIPSLPIKPLDNQMMEAVVKGWHPTMPPEHIDFVVHFADGFIRLAWLASNAVAMNPLMNIREMLNRDEIRGFLDGMLGNDDRRPLYVVAVLTSIGWTEDKQAEGEVVAHHLGLDWASVRYIVEQFNNRFGIVPRGGRYRYISPTPLGIHLAVEAWNTYPDLIRSLPEVLPTEEAVNAYYERLQSMASNPHARAFAREELSHFFRLDDFLDVRAVRRWAAVSAADPGEAARNIFLALAETSIDDRKRIQGDTRRQIVWTLVRLAWKLSPFHYAVKVLALLAEAENESWANNATGEFVDRFQIYLSGTAMPYQDRMLVLDELLAIGRPALISLVIRALSKIGNRQWSRMGGNPASDEVPEREWQPRSIEESLDCVKIAITKLIAIANLGIPELQDDFVTTAKSLGMLLREVPVRNLVEELYIAICGSYPQTREDLRRIIAGIIQSEKKFWNEISEEDLHWIETLHEKFQESSLEARLLQYVGPELWELDEQPDLDPLAEELFVKPDLLAEQWPWLTSGSAANGWRLGELLSKIDTEGKLANMMPVFPNGGHDLRLLCAYIKNQWIEKSNEWFDRWFTEQFQRDPKPIPLLFEVIWRCGATELTARKLIEILRSQEIRPNIVGSLAYGNWSDSLPEDVLRMVLQELFELGHRETAIGILMHRLKNNPGEMGFWDSLALNLVLSPDLIRSSHMVSFYWKEIATSLVPVHAEEIATAILREHAEKKFSGWFLEYSDAATVLRACTSQNPTGIWNVIKSYLTQLDTFRFTSSFPRGVIDIISAGEVIEWVSVQPEIRAKILAEVISINLLIDNSIASQILGKYGDNEQIARSFFSSYLPGSWSGQASAHWDNLADKLDQVQKQTSLPKLRLWASNYAGYLRQMAERERHKEAEEDIGRR